MEGISPSDEEEDSILKLLSVDHSSAHCVAIDGSSGGLVWSVPVPIRISHPSQRQRILNALKHYAPAAAVGGLGGVIAGAAIGMFTAGPVGAVVGGFAGAAGGAAVGASGRAVYSWFTGSKKDKTV